MGSFELIYQIRSTMKYSHYSTFLLLAFIGLLAVNAKENHENYLKLVKTCNNKVNCIDKKKPWCTKIQKTDKKWSVNACITLLDRQVNQYCCESCCNLLVH